MRLDRQQRRHPRSPKINSSFSLIRVRRRHQGHCQAAVKPPPVASTWYRDTSWFLISIRDSSDSFTTILRISQVYDFRGLPHINKLERKGTLTSLFANFTTKSQQVKASYLERPCEDQVVACRVTGVLAIDLLHLPSVEEPISNCFCDALIVDSGGSWRVPSQ